MNKSGFVLSSLVCLMATVSLIGCAPKDTSSANDMEAQKKAVMGGPMPASDRDKLNQMLAAQKTAGAVAKQKAEAAAAAHQGGQK